MTWYEKEERKEIRGHLLTCLKDKVDRQVFLNFEEDAWNRGLRLGLAIGGLAWLLTTLLLTVL